MGRIETQTPKLNISQAKQAFRHLKRGVVPPRRINYFTVGFDKEISSIDAALKDVTNGIGRYLFIEGKLGGGKSHLLKIAELMAIRANFAVTRVVFDGDIHAFNYPQRYLYNMFENLSVPKLIDKGLSTLISHWLSTDKRDDLLNWAKNSAPQDIGNAIRFFAMPKMQASPYYETQSENYRKCIDCRDIQFQSNARYLLKERLSSRAQLCRIVGLNGLVVLFDEVESIAVLLTNIRSRLISYGILEELNRSNQFSNCFFLFAVTPDFNKRIHDDKYCYEYYQYKYLEGCKFTKKWIEDSCDKISLEMVPKEDNIHFCMKSRELHEYAYSWKSKIQVPNSFIKDFVHIAYDRNLTQREIVTTFVEILEICQQNPSCHAIQLLSL